MYNLNSSLSNQVHNSPLCVIITQSGKTNLSIIFLRGKDYKYGIFIELLPNDFLQTEDQTEALYFHVKFFNLHQTDL